MPEYALLSIRLGAAFLLGGIIGLERHFRSKDAGFRTHSLVSMGSALFTVLSVYGFTAGDDADSSRVAAQIVSGVGFLGAGLIILQKNVVKGLTTAAGLWVTAAIGMACGVAMFEVAAIATVLMLIGLEIVNKLIPQRGYQRAKVSCSSASSQEIKALIGKLRDRGIQVYSLELKQSKTAQGAACEAKFELRMLKKKDNSLLLELLEDLDNVTIVAAE